MLLYDRLLERAWLVQKKHGKGVLSSTDHLVLKLLRQAAIYDLSAIVPLFACWETEKAKQVPRRPPAQITFCEWDYSESDQGWPRRWRVGHLIVSANEMPVPKMSMFDNATREERDSFKKFLEQAEEAYYDYQFYFLEEDNTPPTYELHCPAPLPCLAQRGWIAMWAMREQSCVVADLPVVLLEPGPSVPEIERPFCNMWTTNFLDQRPLHPLNNAWPAFMGFSLLHCRNVVSQSVQPDEGTQRQCRKHGRPERCIHKILKIEVPRDQIRRESLESGSDDGPKVRFHLCSGHFKNLQHERFKEKGWHWWPAHWRGSRGLGRVEKSYRLEPT